jgi:hypothetical protein
MPGSAAAEVVAPAVVERVRGRQPSRVRSLVAAGAVGMAAAVITYRVLRSAPADDGTDTE